MTAPPPATRCLLDYFTPPIIRAIPAILASFDRRILLRLASTIDGYLAPYVAAFRALGQAIGRSPMLGRYLLAAPRAISAPPPMAAGLPKSSLHIFNTTRGRDSRCPLYAAESIVIGLASVLHTISFMKYFSASYFRYWHKFPLRLFFFYFLAIIGRSDEASSRNISHARQSRVRVPHAGHARHAPPLLIAGARIFVVPDVFIARVISPTTIAQAFRQ